MKACQALPQDDFEFLDLSCLVADRWESYGLEILLPVVPSLSEKNQVVQTAACFQQIGHRCFFENGSLF